MANAPHTDNLVDSPEWQALQTHHSVVCDLQMRDLFAENPDRFKQFSVSACGLLLDYSKNRVTEETVRLLVDLAKRSDIKGEAARMMAGERTNNTEDRSVLHTALRLPKTESLQVEGVDVVADVHEVAAHIGSFVDKVRDKHWKGFTGKPIDAGY